MNQPDEKICKELPLPAGPALPAGAVLVVSSGIVAESWLSAVELEVFRSLNAIPSREEEWLSGRCAAKEAVRLYLHRSSDIVVGASEVVIVVDERGKPYATGDWATKIPSGVSISIAHSRGVAAAVAWGGGDGPAGLDLEFPRAMSDALIKRSFSEDELARAGGRDHALELWCLKEAAAKATGEGILKSLRDVTVVSGSELIGADKKFSTLLLPFRHGFIAIASVVR